MEAANKGASRVPGARNMGMGITLPFEEGEKDLLSRARCPCCFSSCIDRWVFIYLLAVGGCCWLFFPPLDLALYSTHPTMAQNTRCDTKAEPRKGSCVSLALFASGK